MTRSAQTSDRLARWLERWLVPSILVAIALLQLYLTHTTHLTPWKGGGFGMFATVDALDTRVLAAVGLDQSGERLSLDILDAVDGTTFDRMRAMPRTIDLQRLAPRLIGQAVVPVTVRQQAVYQQLRQENPAIDLPLDPALNQQLYRLRTATDPVLPPGTTKTLKAIRLQWWRLRFGSAHQPRFDSAHQPRFGSAQPRLWTEALGSIVEAGEWEAEE
jgi:hypothetical protein